MSSTVTARPPALVRLKRRLYRSPSARYLYARARSPLDRRQGAELFDNVGDYTRALYEKAEGQLDLRTHDGLSITVRRNTWDAEIVREIFFQRPYTKRVSIGPDPVVVDIGGYIGDFTLYALKYLGASRVVVCEPTWENYAVLQRNIERNGYEDRVVALNAAVGQPGELTLFVEKPGGDEIHASSHWYRDAERRTVPSLSLEQLLDAHAVDRVDLLKVDCEGGEYDILTDAPPGVLERIENVVFEYHEIDDYEPRLDRVLDRLEGAGFALHRDGHIVSARRA